MRRWMAVAAALFMVAILPATAVAAPPTNDLPGGASTIPGIPGSITQTTTGATVTPADDFGCGSGGEDQATVWYRITPSADIGVVIDATGSDYDVGVNLFAGSASLDTLQTCFSGAPGFARLTGGTTYYLMFADIDGGANGGSLDVSLAVAPPPIAVTITVDPTFKIGDKGTTATVTGTIRCDKAADGGGVDLFAVQRVGRYEIRAFGFAETTCGPEPTAWFGDLSTDNGRLAGGKITLTATGIACDSVGQCTEEPITVTVRSRR